MILSKTVEVHCDCNAARNRMKRGLTKCSPHEQNRGSESGKWPIAWLSINETSLMLSESEESDGSVVIG